MTDGDAPGDAHGVTEETLARAAAAVRAGDLVAYPTETVYGIGGDATDPAAVEAVFDAKRRAREKLISMAVADLASAEGYVHLGEREREFAREFLPGPVTLVCERGPDVPDVLTAGRDRVGLRIPDHPVALALLERTPPLTATSANVSGRDSALRASELDEEIRDAVAVVLARDSPPTNEDPQGSTVVDVERGEVHRAGACADAVGRWLDEG